MLRQIMYSSYATSPMSPTSIELLLRKARRANETNEITGLLIHSKSRFIQIFEGPSHAVNDLLRKIECDPRHHSMKIIHDRRSAFRAFPDWEMGFEDNPSPTANDVVVQSMIRMLNSLPVAKAA
ncbi:BLUF domain-containing protein [Sphingomicrobium astaxanthinifaciens]|uniref:BLUF domain-containing protein n=1 Tax=Sphingomicrobium astaxanthinifaciens TaxID=1227949 RepID=UPI001FCBEBA8|nr:BLUF domain-containing protein [Sphingomicrobium astaxanthinifaciens]MCJ7420439.1 BLUF domain-containing protein [Sphingomicrobium astaxanthinifaciens]